MTEKDFDVREDLPAITLQGRGNILDTAGRLFEGVTLRFSVRARRYFTDTGKPIKPGFVPNFKVERTFGV